MSEAKTSVCDQCHHHEPHGPADPTKLSSWIRVFMPAGSSPLMLDFCKPSCLRLYFQPKVVGGTVVSGPLTGLRMENA